MFKAGGRDADPEVLQVRAATAFAEHASTVLTAELMSFAGLSHLHLTGITLGISAESRTAALALLDAARSHGATVSFDPNLRLNLWPDRDEMRAVVNSVAAQATLVLPGIGEGELLTGHTDPAAIADFYLEAGAEQVVLKLGADGAQAWDGTETVKVPSLPRRTGRHRRGRRRVCRRLPGRVPHRPGSAGLRRPSGGRRCPGHDPPRRPRRHADPHRTRPLHGRRLNGRAGKCADQSFPDRLSTGIQSRDQRDPCHDEPGSERCRRCRCRMRTEIRHPGRSQRVPFIRCARARPTGAVSSTTRRRHHRPR